MSYFFILAVGGICKEYILKKFIFCLGLYLFFSCASVRPLIPITPSEHGRNTSSEEKNETANTEINKEDKTDKSKEDKASSTQSKNKKTPTTLSSLLLEASNIKSKEDILTFCDVINKNKSMFDDVSLKVFTQPSPTTANQDFEEEFCAKLEVANDSLTSNALSSLNFVAEYTIKTKDASTKEYKKLELKNDTVSFKPPISNVAIDSEIKIYLNPFNSSSLEEDVKIINENIDSEVGRKLCVTFLHKVATPNRRLSMAIAVLDHDQNGKPILKENIVANRLFVKMMRSGFSRTGLAPFEVLANADNDKIINNAKAFFKGAVEYYIFGKTYMKNVEKNADGAWQAQIESTLYIWNLKTNKKLFEFVFQHTGKGKNQWEATHNARVSLGEDIMYHKILYNF